MPLPVEGFEQPELQTGLRTMVEQPQAAIPPQPVQKKSALDFLEGIYNKLTGSNGENRYQLWPERLAREGFTAPGNVLAKTEPSTTESLIEPALATSGLMGGSTIPAVASRGLAKDALGIIPVAKAKELNVKATPASDVLKSVVENTQGASIDADGHLILNLERRQKPDQEMSESVRGGVFYLPKGDKNFRHYNNGTGKQGANVYGGEQQVIGETAFKNPLLVKGATGGKAPEAAYTQLMGKDAFKQLQKDVDSANIPYYVYNKEPWLRVEEVSKFLEKHAPELMNHAEFIIDNSSNGNQLRYALQEAAIASAARKAGHDGIVGYSELRGADKGKKRISEVFDVRENRYPSPTGDYSIHEQFLNSK